MMKTVPGNWKYFWHPNRRGSKNPVKYRECHICQLLPRHLTLPHLRKFIQGQKGISWEMERMRRGEKDEDEEKEEIKGNREHGYVNLGRTGGGCRGGKG